MRRHHSPEQGSPLRRIAGQPSVLRAQAAVGLATSTPVLRGRGSKGGGVNSSGSVGGIAGGSVIPPAGGEFRPETAAVSSGMAKVAMLSGSSLGQLISRMTTSVLEKEQDLRRQHDEQRELKEILARSKDELQQLVAVVSQLHDLQQSASEVLPEMLPGGPERPRQHSKPPFCWQPSQEYADQFEVSGEGGEVVTKTKDFEDQGWVIPVGGSLHMSKGAVYRWTLRIERKSPSRPQLQLGVHGLTHCQPWRLVTTSRCSWSRDDEPWQDRQGGDRLIDEGDYVHVEIDMRGVRSENGTMALAINDEPFEQFFDDIPLNTPYPLIPVISMGGDQSRVRLCHNY